MKTRKFSFSWEIPYPTQRRATQTSWTSVSCQKSSQIGYLLKCKFIILRIVGHPFFFRERTGRAGILKEDFKTFLRCKKREMHNHGNQLTDTDGEADDTKTLKHCFGPSTTCQNCESRRETPREESNFKRCTACYVVAYCSEVMYKTILNFFF